MSQVANYYLKRSDWKRLYDWDFSRFDEFATMGEVGIGSADYTFTGNVDNNLTIESLATEGPVAQLLISGGTPGATYTITVGIVTQPSGYKLDWDGILRIIP